MKLVVRAVLFSLIASHTPWAQAVGGFSGGGGNVMFAVAPTRPMPIPAVEQAVVKARAVLISYLASRRTLSARQHLSPREQESLRILFNAPQPILEIVLKTRIGLVTASPCFDEMGGMFDASTLGWSGGSICVSTTNLALKVSASEMHAQTAALLLHEFSEVAGLSDEQAIKVQATNLNVLRSYY